MYHLASLLERHIQGLEIFNPTQLVDEFAGAIQKEMDFHSEALHIEHFARNFADDPTVVVPKVYHEFTSRKVITTQFMNGIKITNISELIRAGLDPKTISERGAQIVLKQIFVHGFFHADPHAGNILVTPQNEICLLDLGMTGILTPTSRERLSAIIVGVAAQDPQRIVKTLYEMSEQRLERLEELEYQISELIQEYASRSLSSINISEIMNQLARLLIIHKIKVFPGFYLLVKALVTMEGIGYKLNPAFNMMEHLDPFARKLVHEQFNPVHIVHETYDAAQELVYLMRDLPSETRIFCNYSKRAG